MSGETQKPVSWEAVKVLALAVGVREAARRLGLKEENVKKRCTREGWLKDPTAREANELIMRQRLQERGALAAQSPKVSPSAVMASELLDLSSKSRLGFAKASAGVAAHVASRDPEENLMDAQNVKAAAQTANMVFGWSDSAPNVKIRLDVLNAPNEQPIFDVEADVTPSESWDNELDDY